MKLKLILATAIVGAALALPSVSSAAPPAPTFQDSVSVTEAPAIFDFVGSLSFTIGELTATSGPSGENPTGQIFWTGNDGLADFGPITCLAVSGNTATFNYVSSREAQQIATGQVVDDSPDTITQFILGRAKTDCSPIPAGLTFIGDLTSGDIKVVDAQAPTTRSQCLNDGWRQFGFANQGLCLAYVSRS